MATATVARARRRWQGDVIPDARELHRVITASVRELLETARLEAQAGPVDEDQIERLIFRAPRPSSKRRRR